MNYQGIPVTGCPFVYRDAEYKKEPAKRIFLMFSSTGKVLKKLKKITQICLTYLTSLCYSKKCAIVDSYAMTAYEKQQKYVVFETLQVIWAVKSPARKINEE